MGREIEPFEPTTTGEVRLYTCGPTVWNYAHIGNLRTYLFEDLLRRVLEEAGYTVKHVMNITDVGHLTGDEDDGEDKMIKGARESGKSVWEIAEHYTDAFFADTDALNIKRPSIVCRATDHVDDMISLIHTLEERGHVYASGGNIYFDTSKFEGYGRLALLDRQKLMPGARIAIDTYKKNPADFVLWFTNSKFEHQAMQWDSPWGRGYPGWHIECSAMSMKYLGDSIDIHCGGIDHVPVHHTNEIAQSEGATGKKWVKLWMHGEYLITGKAKMAKSAGNFLTLSELMNRGFDPLDYRYLCLGAHYRSQLQFTDEAIAAARSGRHNLIERLTRLREQSEPTPVDAVGERASGYLNEIEASIAGDLGLPGAVGTLWTMLKDESVPGGDRLGVSYESDKYFGLKLEEGTAGDGKLSGEHLALIAAREDARKRRDFGRADEIRDRLAAEGIDIEDTPGGTRWAKRKIV